MPSITTPVIETGRGVHCVNEELSRVLPFEEGELRPQKSRTSSGMEQRKRCAIVLERDQSLSSNPHLATWCSETDNDVRRALSSHTSTSDRSSARHSKYHNKEELINSRGSIRRDTLKRKPVPAIPPELQEAQQPVERRRRSSSSHRTPMSQCSSGSSNHTLTDSPKTTESDLRTLVGEGDSWDFVSTDAESVVEPPVLPMGRNTKPPFAVFLDGCTKAAKAEASRAFAISKHKKEAQCSRAGCHSVFTTHDALASHLIKHELCNSVNDYADHLVYKCLTEKCRCVFATLGELNKHREKCGWTIEVANPTTHPSKKLLSNVKNGIVKHIPLIHHA